MKLGPVTELDKRNRTTSKEFYDDFMLETFLFFQFMTNLEQSGSPILDA